MIPELAPRRQNSIVGAKGRLLAQLIGGYAEMSPSLSASRTMSALLLRLNDLMM